MAEWRDDILGEGFMCRDIELGEDSEGPIVATLVRSLPKRLPFWDRVFAKRRLLENVDILYVHGWSDYFFQADMARFFTERGARFFALDLRKYGRSLREGQTAGYIEHLSEYDAEINAAIQIITGAEVGTEAGEMGTEAGEMGTEAGEMGTGSAAAAGDHSPRRLILFGHSTGGLVLSLWADRHPGVADALLLNSPWLEFQLSASIRQLVTPLVRLGARWKPLEVAPQFDFGFYSRAQSEVGPSEELARVVEEWRPERSHPVVAGWLHAVLEGHSRVGEGLSIDVPICMLLSMRTVLPARWGPELTSADSVLEVDEVAKAALNLGPSLTIERIDGALHDVFLSAEAPRARAYERSDAWMRGLTAQWRAR